MNKSQTNAQTYRILKIDINGDQQADNEETKDWRFFDEAAANHDGVATSEEIRSFLRSRRN